ncbi:hypothetical protein [Sporosarcina sp. FSL K6-3508]|uniref:hypothetical protein n=1 Tax=Sporosarcina sp. FSL K6-3508 TaxID=2921557 RepID=UPI003159B243
MKPIDFKEKKAESEGIVTALRLIKNLAMAIERGEIESVVYVTKKPTGEVGTGYSQGSPLEILGLLRCGEEDVLDSMRLRKC